MESILKLQEAAAERQQKVAVQLESVARQERTGASGRARAESS